jgi:hypothetical protein
MFIAPLFTLGSAKVPNNEDVCVCVCVYKMDYYSATEKNEIMSLAGKWMELEIIMVSERS